MITDDKYQNFKNNINKSYSEKFKFIRISSLIFSFFGNMTSIFFAFFFFFSLFSTIIFNVNSIWINIGVILFLGLFEYIKRYVFDLFSIEILKKTKLNKKNLSFLLMTIVLTIFSFLFSLNGAQKLINKDVIIQNKIDYNIKVKSDSINNYYMKNYIKNYQKQNQIFLNQLSDLTQQQSILINKGWNTSKISKQINNINEQINLNKEKINQYEIEQNNKINKIKIYEQNKLKNEQNKNNLNIFYFLLLSTLIEIIIMLGVFYNRYYEFKTIKEYEEKMTNTLSYKNWKKYSQILNIIFANNIKINEYIPSLNMILETIDINDLNISKTDLNKCFKVFNHLGISETKGPKRLLKKSKNDSEELLKKYFNIK